MLKWRYFSKYRYISAIFFGRYISEKNRYFSSDFIDLIPICNEIWESLLDSAVMPGIVTMETAAQQTLLLAAFIYAQNK